METRYCLLKLSITSLHITVIIHSKEDKMWVGLDFPPIKLSIYEWDIISSSIAGTRGLIEQKQMRLIPSIHFENGKACILQLPTRSHATLENS